MTYAWENNYFCVNIFYGNNKTKETKKTAKITFQKK